MRHIQTQIIINAPSERVWHVLTDTERYPEWNPFLQSLSGTLAVGEKLRVTIQPPGASAMTFTPVVKVMQPQQELKWLGSGPIKGLFDGEHSFVLEAQADGSTRFIHSEKFTGILIGFMKKMLDNTEVGFQQMNEALKKECERTTA